MCLALGHNIVPPVKLKPATILSLVKPSTTETLRSLHSDSIPSVCTNIL